MATILHIDTATSVCSLSIAVNGRIIAKRENRDGQNHGKLIGVFTRELLDETALRPDAVALSMGPGSYTGLRIGTSFAKGLCYGMDIKLIAIPTLKIIAEGARKAVSVEENDIICPMIDARRMEAYTAFYNNALTEIRATSADIIDSGSYADTLASHRIYFCGDGSGKCKETITDRNAIFLDNIVPLAENMATLAEEAYNNSQFEDVAYFEPFYLKEFIAIKPKNKVF